MNTDAIHQVIALAGLFKMTVIQDAKGEESKLTIYVIANDLAEAVETMNLNIKEWERALPGTYMTILKVLAVGDGLRIAPAIAADIVSQIANGNQSQVQD